MQTCCPDRGTSPLPRCVFTRRRGGRCTCYCLGSRCGCRGCARRRCRITSSNGSPSAFNVVRHIDGSFNANLFLVTVSASLTGSSSSAVCRDNGVDESGLWRRSCSWSQMVPLPRACCCSNGFLQRRGGVGVVGACGVAPCPVRVLGLGAPVLWGGCGQRRRRMWCGCRCRRGERNRWGRWVVWADAVMECRMNSYISLRFSIHKEDTAGRDPLLPREKKGVVAVRVLSPLRR